MTDQTKANARAWSNYWETGFESTFTGHQDADFFVDLDRSWSELFEETNLRSTVVDLGAGNGALTALILKVNHDFDKNFDVIAVDYADIKSKSPIFQNADANLSVKANTQIEDTGIDTESADLCVSQFGFEYADLAKASKELKRILKPGGRFHAVVHHRSSEVSQSCASAHMQIGLCHRSNLTSICSKLIRRLQKLAKTNRSPQQDETAEGLREELNKRAARVVEYGTQLPDQNHINYFINELTGLFGPAGKKLSFSQQLSVIEKVEADAKNFQLRMEAMLRASLDEDGIKAFSEELSSQGLKGLNVGALENDGKVYAWQVDAFNAW